MSCMRHRAGQPHMRRSGRVRQRVSAVWHLRGTLLHLLRGEGRTKATPTGRATATRLPIARTITFRDKSVELELHFLQQG